MNSEITPNLEEILFVQNESAAQHNNEMQFLAQQRGLVNTSSMTFVSLPKTKVSGGVGGTVEKLAVLAALQRPMSTKLCHHLFII